MTATASTSAGTKKKMDQFLDSFDDKVTIWTKAGDETHKTTDNRPGVTSNKTFYSKYSSVPIDALSSQAHRDIETYLRDGYVIMENVYEKINVDEIEIIIFEIELFVLYQNNLIVI